MIHDEIDHETVDSNVITSSGPSESLCVDYDFMVVPTESFFIESSEFLAMIQQVVSGAFFTGCLKFIPESSIFSLVGLDPIVRSYAYSAYCIVFACYI